MAKITLKNVSQTTLKGTKPGQTFQVDADGDGAPIDLYWRKRLADGSAERVASPATPADTVPRSAKTKKD
mgnify:CR=1 FL=1